MDWDHDENDISDIQDYGSDETYNAYDSSDEYQASDNNIDANDPADQWLSAMGEQDVEQENVAFGGMASGDVVTGRYAHTSDQTNLATSQLLSGEISASKAGLSQIDLDILVEDMESITGKSRRDIVQDIGATAPSDVRSIDPKGYSISTKSVTGIDGQPAQTQVKYKGRRNKPTIQDPKFIRQAVSMMKGSETFLLKGPGQNLIGHAGPDSIDGSVESKEIRKEKQDRWDTEMRQANIYAKDLATDYLDQRTIDGPLGELRLEQTTGEVIKRAQEGVFFDGSTTQLALPNELGVDPRREMSGIEGLKITASGGFAGTAHTRLSHEGTYGHLTFRNDVGGIEFLQDRTVRNADGTIDFIEGATSAQMNEYWDTKPSLKKSLYPTGSLKGMSSEEKAAAYAEQNHKMDTAQYKAEFIRDAYRRQQPTTRDEAKGQINMAGFDKPYDEQDSLASIRNDASVLELDWTARVQDANRSSIGTVVSGGQDKGGNYGYTELSEVDLYTESVLEAKSGVVEDDLSTERGRYLDRTKGSPEQRSPEWYAARKGRVTASALSDFQTGKVFTSEELAYNMASDDMGYGKDFVGNAHTELGNRFEGKVKDAFLAGEGKGLTFEEAIFETGEGGMGATPDGRMFNPDGSSAGLAEFKYLTGGARKGALKKYTRQMQQQMLVTEEEQTHFYVKDRHTGETDYTVVKADPVLQAEILSASIEAQEIYSGINTKKELQALEKSMKSRKVRNSEADTTGQTEAYVVGKDTPMEAYRVGGSGTTSAPKGSTGSREEEPLLLNLGSDLETFEKERPAMEGRGARQQESRAAKALDELTKSSEEASKSVSKFGKTAMAIAKEVAGLALGAADSGMDTIRFARKAGMSEEEARGTEFLLMEGGNLELSGARNVMSAASTLQKKMTSLTTKGSTYRELFKAASGYGVSDQMPTLNDLSAMTIPQQLAMKANMINSQPNEIMRANIAEMWNSPDLAVSTVSGADLGTAKGYINVDGITEVWASGKRFELGLQETAETVVAEGGENLGTASVLAEKLSALTSSTAGQTVTGGILAAGGGAVAVKAKAVGKGAAKLARFSAPAAIAGAVPMVARYGMDVKDDGGLADSLLDVADFASYGAGIGGTLGMLAGPGGALAGATVGGIFGTAVGGLNEAWEHTLGEYGANIFGDGDMEISTDGLGAVPSQDISKPSAVVDGGERVSATAGNNTVNVEVNVDPDMVATNVDINGTDHSNFVESIS